MTEIKAGQRWRSYQGVDIEVVEDNGELKAKRISDDHIWPMPAAQIISLGDFKGTLVRDTGITSGPPLPGDQIEVSQGAMDWLQDAVKADTGLDVKLTLSTKIMKSRHIVGSSYAGNAYYETAPEQSTLGPGNLVETAISAVLHAMNATNMGNGQWDSDTDEVFYELDHRSIYFRDEDEECCATIEY